MGTPNKWMVYLCLFHMKFCGIIWISYGMIMYDIHTVYYDPYDTIKILKKYSKTFHRFLTITWIDTSYLEINKCLTYTDIDII
jgi:hypothetical protein